jgi:hypothetical protein
MMFDEIFRTEFRADGEVDLTLAENPAQEMEEAVADFCRRWHRFSKIDPAMATCSAQLGIEWWRAAEWLMLSESRLKEAFILGDRSPRSIAQFHKYKLKLIDGKHYRTDA